MMKAALYTKDGGFVEEIDMPPFVVPPDVVVWGERIFCLSPRAAGRKRFPGHRPVRYDEAFAWYYAGLRAPPHLGAATNLPTGGTPGCAAPGYLVPCPKCGPIIGDHPGHVDILGPEEVDKAWDEKKKR